MSAAQKGESEAKAKRREAIVEAARSRFRRSGLTLTTLEMVARDAAISRPNLYRFFRSKTELVTAVLVSEARAINEQRARKVRRKKTFEDKVVRAFESTVEAMHTNPFWSEIISPEHVPHTAYVAWHEPGVVAVTEEFWLPILEQGKADGRLRADLEPSECLPWLLGLEFMFMERTEIFGNANDVGRYVRRFVLQSLTREVCEG